MGFSLGWPNCHDKVGFVSPLPVAFHINSGAGGKRPGRGRRAGVAASTGPRGAGHGPRLPLAPGRPPRKLRAGKYGKVELLRWRARAERNTDLSVRYKHQ